MKRVFFSLLAVGAIILFFSTVSSTSQQGTFLKSGEDPGIPNKSLYKPYDDRTFNPATMDPTVLSSMSPEEQMRIQQGSYDTTIKYRGVLAVNIDGDAREEVIVDFGSLGVYLYDPYRSPQWTQLDTRNPQTMVAADRDGDGDYEIFCNWGSGNGSDYWDNSTGWHFFQNTGWHDYHYYVADVENDGDDEIIVANYLISGSQYDVYVVGSGGTWGWKRAVFNDGTNSYGHACQFSAADDEIVHAYNGLSWWNYYVSDPDFTDNWSSMTGNYPDTWDCVSANVDGDGEEEFCADVLGALWIYDYSNATKWVRAVNYSVYDMRKSEFTVGTEEELLVSFNSLAGLWMYMHNGVPKWQRLNGLTPDGDQGFLEVFNPDGDTDWDLAVDFGSPTGLWRYDWYSSPRWTPFNGNDPIYMVKVDLNADGEDELLVKFVSPAGLWKWDDDTTPNWIRINAAVPD